VAGDRWWHYDEVTPLDNLTRPEAHPGQPVLDPLQSDHLSGHGYPDYLLKESGQLIDEQYANRQALGPILDLLTEVALSLGEVSVQARKPYVPFCTPRAFALELPVTRSRIDLWLRLTAAAVRPCAG
jgi:Domain of unknown function (DUF5655)